jgi:hypothetical protein
MKKHLVANFIIIAFSLLFAARVVTIFTADRVYRTATKVEEGAISAESAAQLLDTAIKLDSTDAKLYFAKHEMLEILIREGDTQKAGLTERAARRAQLALLKHAIELRPLWPKYHLDYAATLYRMSPRANIMTRQLILSQLKKAAELKPYSPMYQGIYQKYLDSHAPQTP